MNRKRHTALKKRITEYLHVIGWCILVISVIALGEYIANQIDLLLFEKDILPKILIDGE